MSSPQGTKSRGELKAAEAGRASDGPPDPKDLPGLQRKAREGRHRGRDGYNVPAMQEGAAKTPRVPRYELEEEVGSGGMSVVYRAVDGNLGREVAVKILHRHLAGRKEERGRFSREAQAVARLRHPSILEIYDYSGHDSAEAYIVSEFIRGPTLRHFAEKEGMGLPEIGAMVTVRIASALVHAHAQGVIHRDVKPENVMIQDDGTVKLTDFGIARMVDRDERMTQTGSLLGSPAHMPPEIIAGEPVDHRADIFSLGTVLYWLSCDAMPYSGGSPAEVLRRIVESDYQEPRLIDPRVSDELAAIIAKAMARCPDDRYSSVDELQAELEAYLADLGFERVEEELASFFEDPAAYKRSKRAALVDTLMKRGGEAAARREVAAAISAFDRVLALVPGHEGARAAVDGLRRRRANRTLLARALAGSAAVAACLAIIYVIPWRGAGEDASPAPVPPDDAAVHSTETESHPAGEKEPARGDDLVPASSPLEPEQIGPSVGRPGDTDSKAPISASPEPRQRREPSPSPRDAAVTRPIRILVDTWADIAIDGERLARDREARRELPVGRYDLTIQREGFVPVEEEIEVPPGDEVLELRHRLVPRPALVRVVNDQQAAVTLNDKLLGPATRHGFEVPITFPEQPDGRFEYPITAVIRIEKPGFLEQVHRLRLRPGQVEEIVAHLEPEA